MSCSQERWARPSEVRVMIAVKTAMSTSVVMMMKICMFDRRTMNSPWSLARSMMTWPPVTMGCSGFGRPSCAMRTYSCSTMDMPMAEIRGARRKDPRRGR